MVTYMLVDSDEYSLPVYESSSRSELARVAGVTRQNLYMCMKHGWLVKRRYRVEVIDWTDQ